MSFSWKMFAVLFIFALVTVHASELPSYIHACDRKDSNYDQCITDNVNSIKERLCKGLPEFDVSPIEPIIVDKIVIYDTNELKLYLRDSKTWGICNFTVNSIHTNPDRLHFDFDALFNHIIMDTSYDFDMHLLVPLAHKGLATITSDPTTSAKINLDLKVTTKKGKRQVYAWKVNTNINVPSIKYEFDESEKEFVQLHQALSNVVDSNMQDIILSVKPILEEKISQIIILLFNSIMRSNSDILFSEKK